MQNNMLDDKRIGEETMLWNIHVWRFMVRSLIHQIVHSGFGPVVLQLYREPPKDESQASITQNQISSWWYLDERTTISPTWINQWTNHFFPVETEQTSLVHL